jgi:hypothetical protein
MNGEDILPARFHATIHHRTQHNLRACESLLNIQWHSNLATMASWRFTLNPAPMCRDSIIA